MFLLGSISIYMVISVGIRNEACLLAFKLRKHEVSLKRWKISSWSKKTWCPLQVSTLTSFYWRLSLSKTTSGRGRPFAVADWWSRDTHILFFFPRLLFFFHACAKLFCCSSIRSDASPICCIGFRGFLKYEGNKRNCQAIKQSWNLLY